MVTADEIKELLKQVRYPGFSRDIVSFGLVRSVSFSEGTAQVELGPDDDGPQSAPAARADVDKCLRAAPGVERT